MDGGRFEAANKADFSDATVLHIHSGPTTGNWYDIQLDTGNGPFRYVRYIGKDDSYCNINEMEFFSTDGEKIIGSTVGTSGISGKEKEKVFDGDILTGFEGDGPDGHWVGLRFDCPKRIARIRYIGRTDGNCVEIGDRYELLYWGGGGWVSSGEKTASADTIVFQNVPSGALYLLRDLTKGQEERIFIYENENQIWF